MGDVLRQKAIPAENSGTGPAVGSPSVDEFGAAELACAGGKAFERKCVRHIIGRMEGTGPPCKGGDPHIANYYRYPRRGGITIDGGPRGIVIAYPAQPPWRVVALMTILAMGFCAAIAMLPMMALGFQVSALMDKLKELCRRFNGACECRLELTSRHFVGEGEPEEGEVPVVAVHVTSGRLLASFRRETKLMVENAEGEVLELHWLRNRPPAELEAIAQQLRRALHLPAQDGAAE